MPPRKKTISNSAKNHQELALMNNLCFGTVVPTTTSVEVQHWRRNKKKLNSAEKQQNLALLNSFFWHFCTPQLCWSTILLPKNKKRLNSAWNDQKLAFLNSILFGAVVLTLNSTEEQHCRQKKYFQLCQQSSKIGTNEQPLFRHCSTNYH